ncbi:MAG: PAS domain-containing protein [Methylococcaceae bacterium]|nr:PAS domain-containing protein [Methylococcaceae bacterium]MDP3019773.1 PAS domain-containing protein [Methylococcaceae bacterium]MDP3389622.1 PAS domain-containing protein [Methylococcaceae bacterium]MDP3933848.1 PAS domain-containing protein [Methylococcaceae bacterium]MDZ4156169.1 PAS domain-containing protein [Methylococcales bacterium]
MPNNQASKPRLASRSGIVSVVLVYAVFAGLWILLSDQLMQIIVTDPEQLVWISMFKGWLFVCITSMLLYGTMLRWVDSGAETLDVPKASHWFRLPFLSLVIIICLFTATSIINTREHQKQTEIAKLQAIADLKATEVIDWLKERQRNVDFVQTSRLFAEQFQRWQETGDEQSGQQLQARLEQFATTYGFAAVSLLDGQGNRLWGTSKAPQVLSPNVLPAVAKALVGGNTQRMGPTRDAAGQVWLDFIVPLTVLPGPAPIIVLHADLTDWLLPKLHAWPLPSASGEMLLLRRDGDQVLYLNDLRYPQASTANLTLPIATDKLLAAQALRGDALTNGAIEGVDYRGIASIGVARPIEGTDWLLLAKFDQADLYRAVAGDTAWISFAGLVTLFVSIAGFYLLRQGQQLAVVNAVRQVQEERLDALNLLSSIADSSDDAIFAKDLAGRYTLFNSAASRFVGKSVETVLGQDDRAIFPPEQAEKLMAIGRQIIANKEIFYQEEALDTTNGTRTFLATKGPLRDKQGQVIGIFGISRDITVLKQVEQSLREGEERLRLAQSSAHIGIWDWDLITGTVTWTAELEAIYGYPKGSFPGTYSAFSDRVYPNDLADVERLRDEAVNAHQAFDFDFRVQLPSDITRWVSCKGGAIYDDTGKAIRVFGVNIDITKAKIAEQSLRQQSEEITQRNEELERFNRAMVGRELEMIELKKRVNKLSGQLGHAPPYPLDFIDAPLVQQKTDGSQ